MKSGNRYLILPLIIIVVLAACSKGGTVTDDGSTGGGGYVENPGDTTAPVLDIYTPSPDQVFTSGSSINVTGRITDDAGLYQGYIRVTDDANGAVLKFQPYEIHGIMGYNFNISYATAVTAVSNYTVTVSFQDHGLNFATKSVKVKVNP